MIKRLAVLSAGLLTSAGLVLLAPAGPAHASGVNCSDFASQAAAQHYFLAHGGPSSDPEGLDADGDGIACESNPGPYDYSTNSGGNGGGSSHTSQPAKQHSRVTVRKTKHGAHGWKLVATVKKNGHAWKHKRTVLQAKVCGSFQQVATRKTGSGGRATFLVAPGKRWNNTLVCGVKQSHVQFRVHVAKQGKVPAASSHSFRIARR